MSDGYYLNVSWVSQLPNSQKVRKTGPADWMQVPISVCTEILSGVVGWIVWGLTLVACTSACRCHRVSCSASRDHSRSTWVLYHDTFCIRSSSPVQTFWKPSEISNHLYKSKWIECQISTGYFRAEMPSSHVDTKM